MCNGIDSNEKAYTVCNKNANYKVTKNLERAAPISNAILNIIQNFYEFLQLYLELNWIRAAIYILHNNEFPGVWELVFLRCILEYSFSCHVVSFSLFH